MLSALCGRRTSYVRISLNDIFNSRNRMAGLCFLRCVERLATSWESCSASALRWARRLLGPEPDRIFLLPNGDIVRTSPGLDVSGAFVYEPTTRQVVPINSLNNERKRPVPFVALALTHNETRTDLSEWVGELRSPPLPFQITAVHLVRLYSLAYNTYISSDATIHYTTNAGDEGTVANR